MLRAVYAECHHGISFYDVCQNDECRHAKCLYTYADCHGASTFNQKSLNKMDNWLTCFVHLVLNEADMFKASSILIY
jgi:hypothetical protein